MTQPRIERSAPRRLARLAIIAAPLLLAGHPAHAKSAARQPNFLVIVADDLAYSDLGAFGGEIATPHLDALARGGVRLANFHTAPACAPTRASLLTGSDPHRVGLGNMPESMAPNQAGKRSYEGYLRADTATLAERLEPAGYSTLFSGKWHLGVTSGRDPHARGFQHSFAMLNCCHNHFGLAPSSDRTKMSGYTRNGELVTRLPADFYSSDYFADQLIEILRETRGQAGGRKPFFAYLAFTAPHAPLQAPPDAIAKYRGRYDAGYDALRQARARRQRELGIVDPALAQHHAVDTVPWTSLSPAEQRTSSRKMEIYAAMVDRLDSAVGRVIAELKAGGEYDDTVIVFLSDNGAEARDPPPRPGTAVPAFDALGSAQSYVNYGAGWAQAGTVPFWRFKSFATEGGIRAPAIVSGPGVRGAGRISHAYTHVNDVVPTLLELAAVPAAPGQFAGRTVQPIDGLSWRKMLSGAGQVYPPGKAVGTELFGSRAIQQGNWKITDIGNGIWHLFDIAADPGETRDLSVQQPQRKAAMLTEWRRYASDVGVVMPDPPFHPNPPRDHD